MKLPKGLAERLIESFESGGLAKSAHPENFSFALSNAALVRLLVVSGDVLAGEVEHGDGIEVDDCDGVGDTTFSSVGDGLFCDGDNFRVLDEVLLCEASFCEFNNDAFSSVFVGLAFCDRHTFLSVCTGLLVSDGAFLPELRDALLLGDCDGESFSVVRDGLFLLETSPTLL